jgi:hypothetical protein
MRNKIIFDRIDNMTVKIKSWGMVRKNHESSQFKIISNNLKIVKLQNYLKECYYTLNI